MIIQMVQIWTDDVKNENNQQGCSISTRDLLFLKPFCGGIGIGLPTHMEFAFQVDMYDESSLIAFVIYYPFRFASWIDRAVVLVLEWAFQVDMWCTSCAVVCVTHCPFCFVC